MLVPEACSACQKVCCMSTYTTYVFLQLLFLHSPHRHLALYIWNCNKTHKQMSLTPEAIIAIVALLIALPPAIAIMWKWLKMATSQLRSACQDGMYSLPNNYTEFADRGLMKKKCFQVWALRHLPYCHPIYSSPSSPPPAQLRRSTLWLINQQRTVFQTTSYLYEKSFKWFNHWSLLWR